MKGGIIILILMILLSSFASSETAIIINQNLNPIYNLGSQINLPIVMTNPAGFPGGLLYISLLCNGEEKKLSDMIIPILSSGEEYKFDIKIPLINIIIGNSIGNCKIKLKLNEETPILIPSANTFKISDLLNVQGNLQKTEFNPGESISITGKVTRETGENSNGFVDISIVANDINQNINQFGSITEGTFYLNLSLPRNIKAGNYLIRIKAFERNTDGITTNTGVSEYNISVRQIPTNLELIMDKEVMPGASIKIKAVLHDQTGRKIDSTALITIKDSNEKILEQKDLKTDESLEYPIKNNEPPAEWKVSAASNKLTAENKFLIKVKEEVDIQITNQTISITNTGNVPYNKTLLVRVGENPLNIPVMLNIGENKKYLLSAPDGEYDVKISGGEKEVSGFMSLTGNAINVKEMSGVHLGVTLWILLILVFGVIIFGIFRKIYKKPFFGHTTSKIKRGEIKDMPIIGNSITKSGNRAELSLSIKGEKQDASVICLRIKDLGEMRTRKGSPSETIQRIIELAEERKAVTYENQDYLFFILAPTKTRTFKNERIALDIAQKIDNILSEHNKMFNQKIDFGISLNYGTIVAKLENEIFKFMSMGTLITVAKKIAHLSKGEVLLSDKMNDLLRLVIRTDKHVREGVSVFSVKEVKRENEEAKKFIERFLSRQGKQ